jgi:nucleoside-diphosphate-sugar epimerase
LAEKEAWRMAKESGMDLVVVNPSFVVGPLLAPQPTSTLLLILSLIKGQLPVLPAISLITAYSKTVNYSNSFLVKKRRYLIEMGC